MTTRRPRVRRPCAKCGVYVTNSGGICLTCLHANAKRRWRRCPGCGVTTTAKSGVCRPCSEAGTCAPASDEHALTGGRWRRRGLIHIWEPTPNHETTTDPGVAA